MTPILWLQYSGLLLSDLLWLPYPSDYLNPVLPGSRTAVGAASRRDGRGSRSITVRRRSHVKSLSHSATLLFDFLDLCFR